MIRKWHDLRSDLEWRWYNVTQDPLLLQSRSATYKEDLFQGHCRDDGGSNYNPIQASGESFQRLSKLYEQ